MTSSDGTRQDAIAQAIGVRVRAARASAGMTRKGLAERADVSERYLHQLETGSANASVGILLRVAEALGLAFTDLLSALPDAHRPPPAVSEAATSPLAELVASLSLAEQAAALALLTQFLADRQRARRGIALLGLRGAGKSTLGRALAERLNLAFVSVTHEIEARAGMSLNDLFNLGGADAYRSLEIEVLTGLARRDAAIVLETAGGIAGNPAALDIVLGGFTTVWLKASPREHLSRVAGQGDLRPMRGHAKALEHLRALLAQRAPDYARAAHTLDTSGRTVEACLAELAGIAGRAGAG